MKKAASLFFITLFLFNLFGYRVVVQYLQHRASEQLEARLDNNQYNESQLVELKVPMNLPYQTDWAEYQRCNGEIEVHNVLYKYVKRKVVNDTLYVMCIPNTSKMHLETAKDEFFRLSNDLMQNNTSKKSDNSKISFKSLQSEYDEYRFALNILKNTRSSDDFSLIFNSDKLLSSPHISPEQPPDVLYA